MGLSQYQVSFDKLIEQIVIKVGKLLGLGQKVVGIQMIVIFQGIAADFSQGGDGGVEILADEETGVVCREFGPAGPFVEGQVQPGANQAAQHGGIQKGSAQPQKRIADEGVLQMLAFDMAHFVSDDEHQFLMGEPVQDAVVEYQNGVGGAGGGSVDIRVFLHENFRHFFHVQNFAGLFHAAVKVGHIFPGYPHVGAGVQNSIDSFDAVFNGQLGSPVKPLVQLQCIQIGRITGVFVFLGHQPFNGCAVGMDGLGKVMIVHLLFLLFGMLQCS